jgi:hypothetical protein
MTTPAQISKVYLRRRFKAKIPTSRSITTTARISAPVECCQAYSRIFEDGLDGRVEDVLNVELFAIVGDTLVLVKLFNDMTVELLLTLTDVTAE